MGMDRFTSRTLGLTALLCLAPATASAEPFFESVWEGQQGTSQDAVTDGGAWDRRETNDESLVEIRPIDGPGTPIELEGLNMASVTHRGPSAWSMVTKEDVGTDSVEHFYWRMYLRVSSDTNTSWGNVHPFQDFENEDGVDASMNFYIGLSTRTPDRSGWAPYFSSYADQTETIASNFTLTEEEADEFLATDKWYRLEGHIEYLDRQDDDRARTLYEMRVFDPEGDPDTPVLTERDLVAANCSGDCYGTRLGEHYDAGERWYYRSSSTTFTIGTNGPAASTGEGPLYDVTAVALAHDTWIGPYGAPAPDPTGTGTGSETGDGETGDTTGDGTSDGDDGPAPDPTESDAGSGTTGGAAETGDDPTPPSTTAGATDGATSPGDPGVDDNDDGGCGCTAQSGTAAMPHALLLLLGLLGLRRRA